MDICIEKGTLLTFFAAMVAAATILVMLFAINASLLKEIPAEQLPRESVHAHSKLELNADLGIVDWYGGEWIAWDYFDYPNTYVSLGRYANVYEGEVIKLER